MDYKLELEYYDGLLTKLMESAKSCRDTHAKSGNKFLESYYNGIVSGLQSALDELPREEVKTFDDLMKTARELESHLDTEWAEQNAGEYERFEQVVNEQYYAGNLTGKQFNELVLTAFYDYFGELMEDED